MKPSTCFPLVLAFLTASCGTARPVLESDSTRVEVNTVVETKVVRRDSLVYRDRVVKEDIYIEKPLSKWQKLKMTAGEVFIVASIAVLLFFLFLLFTNLKLKV